MANRNIQYTVGFQTNTQQLQSTVSQLQKQLQSVANMEVKLTVPNSEISKAAQAAKDLQSHLQKAINVNTGQLDLTKFNTSLKNAGLSVGELSQKLLGAGKTGTQAFVSMAQAVGQAQVPIKQVNATLQSLATTLKNTVKWQLSSSLVHGLQSALSGALTYAKELNTSLNKIQIVTGQSADQMARFAVQANAAAKQLSTTTKAYTDAALIYYQQGDNDEMVAKKAAITTKAANVAFSASAKEMSDMLTAVWNSYKVGENELQKYVDIMAALGATTATSTEEIATAMSKVAATANNVGVSMEQMSSIIATVSSVTRQSAESIGTSFKTLLARIADLKTGATDEDGVGLGQVSSQLDQVGVKVLDAQGNLRDMGSIIEDLGKKWGTMNKAQQQAIAQAVAGKRQYTQLMALMDNMDKYYTNLNTAGNSSGTLDKQAKTYAESWRAASNQVQASLEEIYNKLLDDKGFISLLNTLNGIIGVVSKLIDGFGGLGGVILSIGTIATQVFNKQIAGFIDTLPQKISNLTQAGRQKNLEKSQNEMMSGINTARDSGTLTDSQHTQLDATENVMKMNQQLMANSTQMSDQQVADAQRVIEQYKLEAEALAEVQQKQEEAKEGISNIVTELKATPEQSVLDKAVGDGTVNQTLTTYYDNLQKIKTTYIDLDGQSFTSTMNLDQVVNQAKEAAIGLNTMKDAFTELQTHAASWGESFDNIDKDNIGEATDALEKMAEKVYQFNPDGLKSFQDEFDVLKQKIQTSPDDMEGIRDKFAEIFTNMGNDAQNYTGKFQASFNSLIASLDNIEGIDPSKVQELKQYIQDWAAANVDAEHAQNGVTNSMSEFFGVLNSQGKVTFGQILADSAGCITSFTALGKSIGNLGKTWSSSASLGSKLVSTLSILPTILFAAKAATKLYEHAVSAKTRGEIATAISSKLAELGIKGFTNALLSSPLAIFAIALMAVAAVFTAITSIMNANAEAEKKAFEATEKRSEALQEEVDQAKKEREALEESYNAWEQYEQARANGTEAGDDYVSATKSVLEALGMERYEILLTIGQYDKLAEAIRKANKERVASNAEDAEQRYKDAESTARTYARTFKSDDKKDSTPESQLWNGRYVLNWASKNMKGQWSKDEMGISWEDFYEQELGLTGSKDHGFDDIRLNGSSAKDLEDFYIAMLNAEEKYGAKLSSIPVWEDIKDWAEHTGGLIYNARVDRAEAAGQKFLTEQYPVESMTADTFSREGMTEKVRQHLISKGYMTADDPRLDDAVQNIVDTYITSLGDSFVDAVNNSKASDIVIEEIKSSGYDLGQEYTNAAGETTTLEKSIRQKLTDRGLNADEVLAASNANALTTTVFGNQQNDNAANQMAWAAQAQWAASRVTSNDNTGLTLGQRLVDAESLAGTFKKKPENKAEIESLFKEYYSDENERQAALQRFWMSSAEGQVQILEEMSENTANVVRGEWEETTKIANAALDEARYSAYGSLVAASDSDALTKLGITTGENISLDDIFAQYGVDDVAGDEHFWEVYTASITEMENEIKAKREAWTKYLEENEGATVAEAEAALGYNLDDIAAAEAEVEGMKANAEAFATVSGRAGQTWNDDLIPAIDKAKDSMKDLTTITGLVKKSAVDTAAEWKKLEEITGESLESLKSKYTNSDAKSWADFIVQSAETQLGTMVKQSSTTEMDKDQLLALEAEGKTIVSDEEYEEAEQKLQKLRQERNQLIYDDVKTSVDKELKEITKAQKALQSVDLNNLPVDATTEAYINLESALSRVNVSMEQFAGQSRIEQLKTLEEAEDAIYQEQLAQQDTLIQAKQAQLDAAETEEERIKLEEELTTLQEGRTAILESEQANSDKYARQIAAQYKTEVAAAVSKATEAVKELNNQMSAAKTLADAMASALSDGKLGFEMLEKLADFDEKYGTNFVEQWNNASTAMERAAVASKVYQQAVAAAAEKSTQMTSAFATIQKSNLSDNVGSQDDLYTWLGESDLSDTAKSLITQAYSNISSQLYEGMSKSEIYALLTKEMNRLVEESKDASDDVLAEYRATMQNIFKDMAEQEKAQAQSTVDTWLSAFKQIKEAKLKIAEGGSLAELLAGDAGGINTILETIMNGLDDSVFDTYEKKLAEAQRLFYAGGSELQAALQYSAVDEKSQLLAQGYNLTGYVGTNGYYSQWESYEQAKQQWGSNHYEDYWANSDVRAAADAAFEEEFRATMKGLNLTDEEIDSIIGGENWDLVGEKLTTFKSATEMATKALEQFAKVEQAKAERDTAMAENQAKAEEAEANANAAYAARHREDGSSVSASIAGSGVSRLDFATEAAKALGLTDVDLSSDEKVDAFLDSLTDEQLDTIYNTEIKAADEFYAAVTKAADDFLAKFNKGGELDFQGNDAAKKEASETAKATGNTVEAVGDSRKTTTAAQELKDHQARTTGRTASLSSLYTNGPQSASDYYTLEKAGIGTAAEIRGMDRATLRGKMVTAMSATMGSVISQSDYDKLSDKDKKANTREIITDEEYAQMQNDQMALNATVAREAYTELNQEIQNTLTTLQNTGTALSQIDLDKMPMEGSAAWKSLDAQMKKCGTSLKAFQSLNREDKIKKLGELQTANLNSQISEYDTLIAQAQNYANDTSLTEAERAQWAQKAIELTNQRAALQDQADQQEIATLQQLSQYYEAEYDKIAKRQAKLEEQANKTNNRASVLSGAVQTGELSFKDRASLTNEQIQKWESLKTAEERAAYAVELYNQAANEQLTARDEAIKNITEAKTALTNIVADSFGSASGSVTKDAFTDMLKDADISPALKGELEKAWDNALGNLSADELEKMSWSEVAQKLQDELTNAGDLAEEELQQKLGEIQDAMIETYKSLTDQEISLAESAVTAWKNAFDKIAAYRKNLASGESIGDLLLGDLDSFVTAVDAYGGNAEALVQAYKSGTLKSSDLTIGSPEEFAKKMKAEWGLEKLFTSDTTGNFSIKNTEALAAQFGIDRSQFTGENAEQEYLETIRSRTDAYLKELLTSSGFSGAEAEEIIAAYWDGAPGAVEKINTAATKMNSVADQYAALYAENQKLEEAKGEYDKKVSQANEKYTKANDNYSITTDLRTGRSSSSITQLTADVDRQAYLKSVNEALTAAGYDAIKSIDEMSSWDINDERWETVSTYFTDAASQAKEDIVSAAKEFKGIVTEQGYGEDSEEGKAATELVTEAETDYTTTVQSYASGTQDVQQTVLDLVEARQSAISTIVNLDSSSSEQERIAAAQALREAYADADEETKAWAESMADAAEKGVVLADANKALTTANLKVGKSYNTMTKAQRLQYKEMLKTNKVTVDGYETLDDYLDVLDNAADVYDEITEAANSFSDRGLTAVTDVLRDQNAETQNVLEASVEDTTSMLQELLPDEYDSIAGTLLSLSQNYAGDINAALTDGWDSTINGFNENTIALLQAMGLSEEQILAMQEETRENLKAGAAIGDINFLSMMADMDVDPTQFDSMITALNNAMHQIEALLAQNGITLDPPWTDIPTLESKGIGSTRGSNSAATTNPTNNNTSSSSSSKSVKAAKVHSEEKERYHEISKQIEEQNNLINKLDKTKSRAYGKAYIDNINAEIAALEKSNELYKQKGAEVQASLDTNRALLEQYGATFNEDGTVNYSEYMDKIIDDYNAAVEKFNSSEQTAADQWEFDQAEERYNQLKDLLADYEEDLSLQSEIEQQILEQQNKISAAALEGIQYKVEIRMDLNDRDIKRMQYFRNKWEDMLDMQDEAMDAMIQETMRYEDNLASLGDELAELDAAYANGTLTEADYADGVKDVNDKILEQLENINTIKKSIKELYENTLSKAKEEQEKYTAVLDHTHSVMEQYIQMQQLMGLGENNKELQKMYEAQYNSSVANVRAAKEYVDTLKASRAEIERQAAESGWTDVLQAQYDSVNEHIREGEDSLLEYTTQSLQDAQNVFNNKMAGIVQSFDETLFGMKNGLKFLQEDYDYYTEESSRYLSTSKELYEVAKLNRQIEGSIADATTKASKERLKALKEQINSQSEANRLTEYDVNMMQLQYEYALALQDLEDAKNAKSTVRLTRDEEGNYGYQYTADEDKIDSAAQKVDDVLQNINELAANRVNEIEQAAVQAEQQYRDSLLAISQDTTLTLEERQARMEELTRRYQETMMYNQEQYGNATTALLQNQQYVYERYGVSISQNTSMLQDQMNNKVNDMINKSTEYGQHLMALIQPGGEIYEAMSEYKEAIGDVDTFAGLNGWAGMTASVEEYEDANKAAEESIKALTDQLSETLINIGATTEKWTQHEAALNGVIDKYETLARVSQDTLTALAFGLNDSSVGGSQGNVASAREQEYRSKLLELTNAEMTDADRNAALAALQAEYADVVGSNTADEDKSKVGKFGYSWAYGSFQGGYDTKEAAESAAKHEIDSYFESLVQAGEDDDETKENLKRAKTQAQNHYNTIDIREYLKGGLVDYTGPAWVDGSKSEPELMLNANDTQNLLETMTILREFDAKVLTDLYNAINQQAMGMMYAMSSLMSPIGASASKELQQNVHIEAEFPNVTEKNEIVEAFDDLINLASQYANR